MDEFDGFTLHDAETVKAVYTCSQCEGELTVVPSFFEDDIYFVICQEHGNVELIGRISKTTVAIRNERGVFDYPKAIRALPDLWGHLIPTKQDRAKMMHDLGF